MATSFGPRGGGGAGGRQRIIGRSIYEEMKPTSQWIKEPSADIVTFQLPGFVKEQIKIIAEISSRVLRVRGERFVEGNKWIRFNEVISVPEYCIMNEIRAKFEGQTLRITLPKETPQVTEPPQPPTRPHLLPQTQTRPQSVPQPQTYPQPAVPQLQRPSQPIPRPQPAVPQLQRPSQPIPRPQPAVPQSQRPSQPIPRPQPAVPQSQRPSQPVPRPQPAVPQSQRPSQPVPQAHPRPSLQTPGPEPPKRITPYAQNMQENLVQKGSFLPKAAFESEERNDDHNKASTGSRLTTADGEKGSDARIVDQERETYKQKRKELTNKREVNKNYDNAVEEQEHVKSTEAKEKFKVKDYTMAMKGLTRNLNEDRQMLINMGVAVLVIVALGAYISSYTTGGSSENS